MLSLGLRGKAQAIQKMQSKKLLTCVLFVSNGGS